MRAFRIAACVLTLAYFCTAPAAERRITPEQEQQLFRSIDEITKFLSADLKMPARLDIKRELVSRDKLRAAAESQFSDPQTQDQRLRTEAVLRKIGFIPRDYDTTAFALNLQSDARLGFYSPKAKTIYIVDALDPGQQSAVLAHELMHAIQDQNVNLREYVSARDEEAPPLNDADEDIYDPTYDDGAMARRAVLEGEAMVGMYDYVVETARSRVRFPGQSERNEIQRAMDAAFPHIKKNPVWQSAPLYLKESATFPYNEGFKFVWALKEQEGPEILAKLLKDPPHSTQEVFSPERYSKHTDEQPFRAAKLARIVAPAYVPLQVTSMGQFDVDIFLRQYAGGGKAARIAPKWNGGVVFAARRSEAKVEKLTGSDVGFAYVSRWQDADAAKRFGQAWTGSIGKRYPGAKANGDTFDTNEGPVRVERRAEVVLVVEGFPHELVERIRDVVFGK